MMGKVPLLAAGAAAFLFAAQSAPARDFWVATTGSDANGTGTRQSPFATIQHADAASVTGFGPGSSIHVAAGIYRGSAGYPVKAGPAAQPSRHPCAVKTAFT